VGAANISTGRILHDEPTTLLCFKSNLLIFLSVSEKSIIKSTISNEYNVKRYFSVNLMEGV
jgi:hypothetical protein